jgi:hypothetical protein
MSLIVMGVYEVIPALDDRFSISNVNNLKLLELSLLRGAPGILK